MTKKALFVLAAKNPIDEVISGYFDDDDKPQEERGVIGIYGDPEASRLCCLTLHALHKPCLLFEF